VPAGLGGPRQRLDLPSQRQPWPLGLAHPSAIALAAWSASRSSSRGASRRRRTWASPAGSTTCSWARAPWTSVIPQAYITARAVRHRLPLCASAQATSWCRRSHANQTRVEMGGRPRVLARGKRWATERATAATRAAHGTVSAPGRIGCVSGTTSATWSHAPRPVSPCWRSRQSGMGGSPDGQKNAAAYAEPISRTIRLGGIN
jgi:hypothetical protein